MKKRVAKTGFFAGIIALFVVAAVFLSGNTVQAADGYPVRQAADGNWYYFNGDNIDWGFSGVAQSETGWWKITNGSVDFAYNGLGCNEYDGSWWYVRGGAVDFGYNGLGCNYNDGSWWYVLGGRVVFEYNGLACNYEDGSWWYVLGGKVIFDYNGLGCNYENNTWWYVNGGQVNFGYNGLGCNYNDGSWWYVLGGQVIFEYNGLGCNYEDNTWWYVLGGKVVFEYTGMAHNEVGWWYVIDGAVHFEYTGLGQNEAGLWYYKDGTIDFTYSGEVNINNVTYVVEHGMAARKDAPEIYTAGAVASGAIENGVYIIRSNDDKNYALTIVEDKTAQSGYNVVMSKITGENNQKFLVVKDNDGNYCFMSMKYLDENGTNPDGKWLLNVPNYGWPSDNSGRDNLMAASSKVDGGKAWQLTETSKGVYKINALRGDDYKFYITADGGVNQNANVITSQTYGNESQSFNFISPYSTPLSDGTYKIKLAQDNNKVVALTDSSVKDYAAVTIADSNDNFDQLFNIKCVDSSKGLYTIQNVNSQRYLYTEGSVEIGHAVSQLRGADTIDKKWYIQENMDGTYSIISANSNQVLTVSGSSLVQSIGKDSTSQKFVLSAEDISADNFNINDKATTLTRKYDLSELVNLDGSAYNNVQVIKRMNSLGIKRDELLNPEASSAVVESDVNKALEGLPTQKVTFTGSTNTELNKFLYANQGKIVVLSKDVTVSYDKDLGVIKVPSNTILDGNGHSLVLASGSEVPSIGIAFFYNDESNNYKEEVSKNCGVRNLTSAIPYKEVTVNAFGADNIVIEENNFSNANMSAIYVSDSHSNRKDSTVNAVIKNNTVSNTGKDAIGIYGNIYNAIIEGNKVSNSGEYGIMLSCLTDGNPVRVDAETEGPHNIIVRNNEVTGSHDCAMYCLGTYKVYITGNTLHDSKLEGICMDSGCIGTYFADNNVYNNGNNGGLPGVSIDNGIYNIVENNNVHDNACIGIKLVRAAYGNVIVENTCTNNSTNVPADTANAGISIETKVLDDSIWYLDSYGSDFNIVYNNNVNSGHVYGIMVKDDTTNAANTGNVIEYNKIAANHQFATVDFSTRYNVLNNNIVK